MQRTTLRSRWLLPSIAFLAVACVGYLAVLTALTVTGHALPAFNWALFAALIAAAKATAFFVASRRRELGRRLCVALQITAVAYCLSFVVYVGTAGLGLDLAPVPVAGFLMTAYVVGVLGVLWMPRVPVGTGASWWMLPFDAVITVLGFGVMLLVLVTLPRAHAIDDYRAFTSTVYGLAQNLMLVGLNVYVLYGLARPSRRAFWLYASGILVGLGTIAVQQLFPVEGGGFGLPDVTVFSAAILMLLAAHAFAHDEMDSADLRPAPAWFRSFNPLPILAILGVAGLVLRAARLPGTPYIGLLAGVLLPQLALYIVRQLLTAWDNARLLAAAAAREQRQQEARMEAVGQLAGGIAHWFNNLMTVVIGHAEMGVDDTQGGAAEREGLHQIRTAANRAAVLTHQLLSFSGRAHVILKPVPLATVLDDAEVRALVALPANVSLDVSVPAAPVTVRVDIRYLRNALRELLNNAIGAMPRGGRVSVTGRVVTLTEGRDSPALTVAPGTYAVIAVADEGSGIAPDLQPKIFDPFYTSREPHEAAGLGLAAVYGIVAAHRGGLTVESAVGAGTSMSIYLPIVGEGGGA